MWFFEFPGTSSYQTEAPVKESQVHWLVLNSMSIAYSSLMIFLESFFLLSILMIYKLKQFKL